MTELRTSGPHFTGRVPVRRRPDGTVEVGAGRPTGLSVQTVAVAGGTLRVDLERIGDVPFVTVDDPIAVAWWLSLLLGAEVADAVVAAAAEVDPVEVEVSAEAGPLAGPLLRLAKGLWVHRWWPLPDGLEGSGLSRLTDEGERFLEAELGALAWFAEDLFGTLDVAEGLLDDAVQVVLEAATNGTLAAPRLLPTLRAIIESSVVDDDTFVRLDELEQVVASSAADFDPAAHLTADVVELSMDQVVTRGDRSSTAIDPRAGSWIDTVPWGSVPPRTISSAEGSVRCDVTDVEGGGCRLDVVVRVHPDSRRIDDVSAAVHVAGEPLPVVVIALTEGPDGSGSTVLNGTAEVDERPTVAHVTVFAPQHLAQDGGAAVADSADRRREVRRLLDLHVLQGSGADADVAPTGTAPRGELLAPHEVDPRDPWFLPDL